MSEFIQNGEKDKFDTREKLSQALDHAHDMIKLIDLGGESE